MMLSKSDSRRTLRRGCCNSRRFLENSRRFLENSHRFIKFPFLDNMVSDIFCTIAAISAHCLSGSLLFAEILPGSAARAAFTPDLPEEGSEGVG